MKKLFIVLSLLGIISCEDSLKSEATSDLIIGHWTSVEYTDSTIVLKKKSALSDDEYGISFHSDGKLTEMKNIGWCGTPPISYGEYEGSWEVLNDSVLSVEAEFWGGTEVEEWLIIEITENRLEYYLQDYESNFTEE